VKDEGKNREKSGTKSEKRGGKEKKHRGSEKKEHRRVGVFKIIVHSRDHQPKNENSGSDLPCNGEEKNGNLLHKSGVNGGERNKAEVLILLCRESCTLRIF